MHNHSIPEPQWKSVFDSLSRIYDGTPSSLEILAGDVGAQYQVENQPFRGVDYDRTGIELHFATRDGSEIVHRIAHAKDVQIEETDSGLIAAMLHERKAEGGHGSGKYKVLGNRCSGSPSLSSRSRSPPHSWRRTTSPCTTSSRRRATSSRSSTT